jgi:predicted acylesterase/phospholipase RssA
LKTIIYLYIKSLTIDKKMEKFIKIKSFFFLIPLVTITLFKPGACYIKDLEGRMADVPREDQRLKVERFAEGSQFQCLSLDGGGVRGVYTAEILHELEKQLPIGKHVFEFFAGGLSGTSTGSFIALGLAAPAHKNAENEWLPGPYSPREITDFYQRMGGEVFRRWTVENCISNIMSGYKDNCLAGIKKALISAFTCFGCFACCKNCEGLCGPKYSNVPLRRALEEKFGDLRLKDALVPVQVVAYDVALNRPRYFSSIKTPEARFVDVALCSSAAPTYFPAVSIDVEPSGARAHCVDGGIFDNSPVFAALKFAVSNHPKEEGVEVHWDDFIVLSVGAGELLSSSRYKKLKHAGLLGRASRAVSIGIDGTAQAAHENMRLLFEGVKKKKNYFRIQTTLTPELSAMDNPRIMQRLKDKASAEYGETALLEFVAEYIASDEDRGYDDFAEVLLKEGDADEARGQTTAV